MLSRFLHQTEGTLHHQGTRSLLAFALFVGFAAIAAGLPGCTGRPPPADSGDPPAEGNGDPSGGEAPPSDSAVDVGSLLSGSFGLGIGEYMQEVTYLLGADRPPTGALRKIREVHDMTDWSYARGRSDGVKVTRKAIAELRDADYVNWDETGIVVVVLSTLAVRDPSGLVRTDCVDALGWFRGWIRPMLAGVGQGIQPSQEDVVSALKALDMLHEGPAEPTSSDLLVAQDAIAVLGSYDWAAVSGDSPLVFRSKAFRPRSVVRRLTAADLEKSRRFPEVRRSLDRAIIRVVDQVIFLSQVAALGDRASYVRAASARALGGADEPRAMAPLLYTLNREEETSVRLELVPAIGTIAMDHPELREQAMPGLAGALSDPNSSVRGAAARELARITGANPGPDPVDWRRWWIEQSAEARAR